MWCIVNIAETIGYGLWLASPARFNMVLSSYACVFSVFFCLSRCVATLLVYHIFRHTQISYCSLYMSLIFQLTFPRWYLHPSITIIGETPSHGQCDAVNKFYIYIYMYIDRYRYCLIILSKLYTHIHTFTYDCIHIYIYTRTVHIYKDIHMHPYRRSYRASLSEACQAIPQGSEINRAGCDGFVKNISSIH